MAATALGGLALAGYFRLRRRGLVEATRWSWVLTGCVACSALALVIPLPGIALALAIPQFAIVWVWSRKAIPAQIHFRAWIVLMILLVAAQTIALSG